MIVGLILIQFFWGGATPSDLSTIRVNVQSSNDIILLKAIFNLNLIVGLEILHYVHQLVTNIVSLLFDAGQVVNSFIVSSLKQLPAVAELEDVKILHRAGTAEMSDNSLWGCLHERPPFTLHIMI